MWWRWSLSRDCVGLVSVKKKISWLNYPLALQDLNFLIYCVWLKSALKPLKLRKIAPSNGARRTGSYKHWFRSFFGGKPDRPWALDVLAFGILPRVFSWSVGDVKQYTWPWPLLVRTTYSTLEFFSNYRNSYPETPPRSWSVGFTSVICIFVFSFVIKVNRFALRHTKKVRNSFNIKSALQEYLYARQMK